MNRSSNPRNPTPTSARARSSDGGESPSADKIRLLIADDHMTVLAGLASIILFVPVPIPKRAWVCKDCGAQWREVPDDSSKPDQGAESSPS